MPSPAVKLGQGKYATEYFVSVDLKPLGWFPRLILWCADWFLKKGL